MHGFILFQFNGPLYLDGSNTPMGFKKEKKKKNHPGIHGIEGLRPCRCSSVGSIIWVLR